MQIYHVLNPPQEGILVPVALDPLQKALPLLNGTADGRESRRAAEDAELLTENVNPNSDPLLAAGPYRHELVAAARRTATRIAQRWQRWHE